MDGSSISQAVLIFSYVIAIGFAGIFAVIIFKMLTNHIDLNDLLSESEPAVAGEPARRKASLSRLQLLVFTFVTAGLFLLLSIENSQMTEIPNGVLGLLGISGGSYLISKGIAKK